MATSAVTIAPAPMISYMKAGVEDPPGGDLCDVGIRVKLTTFVADEPLTMIDPEVMDEL